MHLLINELYVNYLKEIAGNKFTPREVDVIACISNNRSEKKIASILNISPNTVSTHLYNVMNKLGYNSRDNIVDFIQSNGKLTCARKYYFYILADNLLKKYLTKLAKFNDEKISCAIFCDKENAQSTEIIDVLTSYLKLTNINLVEANSNLNDINYNINIIEDDFSLPKNSSKKHLNLLINEDHIPENKNLQYIDFSKKEIFSESLFKLIQQILKSDNIKKIESEFNKEFKLLESSWEDIGEIKTEFKIANLKQSTKTPYWKFLIPIAISFIFLASGTFLYINSAKIDQAEESKYQTLDELFSMIEKHEISSDNIDSDNLHKHHTIIRQFEKLDANLDVETLKNYFSLPDNREKFVTYLYTAQAAATYYNYPENLPDKSIKILTKAMDLVNVYLNSMSKLAINVNELPFEELLIELSIIKELPEMYARLTYTFAMCYLTKNDFITAKNYFIKCNYLASKLNLFEAFLSKYGRIPFIDIRNILIELNDEKYQLDKARVFELIELYKEANINKKYKKDYKSSNEFQMISIKDNPTGAQMLNVRLIQLYSLLLSETTTAEEIELYKKLILNQITGDDSSSGVMDLWHKLNGCYKASTINIIALSLLRLHDNSINFISIKNELGSYFQLNKADDLTFIEELFKLAINNSRNEDGAKAMSINGLIKVYERKLLDPEITSDQKDNLLEQIKILTKKRNELKNKTFIF